MTDAPAPTPDTGAGNTPPAATPPSPPAATPPEGLDARFWDQTSGQVNFPELTKSYGELAEFKKAHDDRAATLPQTAEEYKVALPADFAAPEGVEIKFDEKDPSKGPILKRARELAKEWGLTQDQFSAVLALEGERLKSEHQAHVAETAAERKKLGENGEARVSAIEGFLKAANLTQGEYEALSAVVYSADAVRGIEKIMARAAATNVPGNTQTPTPAPPAPKSPAERIWPSGFNPKPQQKAS